MSASRAVNNKTNKTKLQSVSANKGKRKIRSMFSIYSYSSWLEVFFANGKYFSLWVGFYENSTVASWLKYCEKLCKCSETITKLGIIFYSLTFQEVWWFGGVFYVDYRVYFSAYVDRNFIYFIVTGYLCRYH